MKKFTQIAPSGVIVTSSVPFVEPRWWDTPVLHPVWSYASWTTAILKAVGWKGPRVVFERYWTR